MGPIRWINKRPRYWSRSRRGAGAGPDGGPWSTKGSAALSGLRGQPQVDTDESQLRQEEAMTVRPPSADAQEYLENLMRGTGWDEAI